MKNNTKVNKRLKSTQKYLDAIADNHSKINVVRIDLAYRKDDNGNVDVSFDDAIRDFNHMMNNRRGKPSIFKDMVGHIVKKEYTKNKGVHFHAAFIFNGQKVQNDSFKGEQLGEYWKQITEGKGTHHNCNKDKKNYKELGIGMIEHNNTKKREILQKNVLSYLCKDEQDIEPIKTNTKDKAFIRGILPKKKSKVGRPRKND